MGYELSAYGAGPKAVIELVSGLMATITKLKE